MSAILESFEPGTTDFNPHVLGVWTLSLAFYMPGLRVTGSKDTSSPGLPNAGAGTSRGGITHVSPPEALIQQVGQR